MKYRLKDGMQATVGAFSAILLFFVLRTDPININATIGFMITLVWVSLFYNGDKGFPKVNFYMALIITAVISAVMSIIFNLATMEQLLSFNFFSSSAVVGIWLGFPIALLMDKYNLTNILKRHYIRR